MSIKPIVFTMLVTAGATLPAFAAEDDLAALPIRKGGTANKPKTATSQNTPQKITEFTKAKAPSADKPSTKPKAPSPAPLLQREISSAKATTPAPKTDDIDTLLLDSIRSPKPDSPNEFATEDATHLPDSTIAAAPDPQFAVRNPQPESPNFYVASTAPPIPREERRNILQRLLGFGKSTAPTPPLTQSAFNSDYATRNSATILPAVLDGAGYNGSDLPIGGEDNYRLASLPTSFRPTDLVQVPTHFSYYGNPIYLRREAANSLCQMFSEAASCGLNLKIFSGYRDYSHQMRLYNESVARRGPNQKMVARPGKSEHQLGTTADVTNGSTHLMKRSFLETPEGRWLAANASRYGWKMTVMAGEGRRSHSDEPWHIRYLGSSVNSPAPAPNYVAQQRSAPQRRDVLGSVGRMLGLRR